MSRWVHAEGLGLNKGVSRQDVEEQDVEEQDVEERLAEGRRDRENERNLNN